MATFHGTYSCGHDGSVSYYGPAKQNQWRADRDFAGLCPDCEERQLADAVAAIREKYAKGDQELPMLVGSDEQILWGEKKREELIPEMQSFLDDFAKRRRRPHPEDLGIFQKIFARMLKSDSAKLWLSVGPDVWAFFRAKKAQWGELLLEETPEEIKLEAAPEKQATTTLAAVTISSSGDRVFLQSDRDEVIRQTARAQGMRWGGAAWELPITPTSGSAEDRAVEIANALLCAGVPIKMENQHLLDKAIAGDFTPRNPRWIVSAGDQHVTIRWSGRSDELYTDSRSIRGARWEPGTGMVVPTSSADAIMDFADRQDFSITPQAKALLDAARERQHHRPKVQPATPAPESSSGTDLDAVLSSSADVLPDLVDDL